MGDEGGMKEGLGGKAGERNKESPQNASKDEVKGNCRDSGRENQSKIMS